MKNSPRNVLRAAFAALILVAFFIPAYSGISGFYILRAAIPEVMADPELTFIDLLVILLPLILLLIGAAFILFRSLTHKPVSSYLLAVPFCFLVFFVGLIFLDVNKHNENVDLVNFVLGMNPGLYLAAFASVLLLLSYSRRESLQDHTQNDYE